MRFITILIFFIIAGCNASKSKKDKQILDFGSFTIETPRSWTKIKAKGIDSYVGKIAIDDSDILHFDLGWYSNKLEGQKGELVLSDTSDGKRCKRVGPSRSGVGVTVIYSDSRW